MTTSEREAAHQLTLDLYNSGQLKLEVKSEITKIAKIPTTCYEFVPHDKEFGKWNLKSKRRKKSSNV